MHAPYSPLDIGRGTFNPDGMASDKPNTAWEKARSEIRDGKLSILMPARNLGASIADNVETVAGLLENEVPYEIVVVDDGSTDSTHAECVRVSNSRPHVKALRIAENVGKGAALRHAFSVATGSHVAFLDADLDLPPGQLSTFLDRMQDTNADVVIGSKMHPESQLDYPFARRVISSTYFFLVKALFGLPIHDTQTGIKLFRRSVLDWVFPRMLVKRYAFDLEILVLAHMQGHTIVEAPVVLDFHSNSSLVRARSIRTVMNDTLAIFYRARVLKYYHAIPDLALPQPSRLVSIIIAYPEPTPNLDEALAAIATQDYEQYEVLLLPDEASGRYSNYDRVREIPTGPVRPAEKRNIGIEAASGSIIAFLDDDAFPVADWLTRALEHFSRPKVIALGGPGCTPSNDSYMARVGGLVYANPLVSGTYRYRYVSERVRDVDDYPSCNLFVRTDALRELGGFRTDYWPGEDTYLCMELVHTLKGRIVYEPWAIVYHHRRPLFLAHLRQIGRYALHRGYFARHFPLTSRRVGYMVPSLFVVGLLAGFGLSFVHPFFKWMYICAVVVYLLITFLLSGIRRPHTWILVWLGVISTHLVYGTRFLVGWFTRRLPSQVEAFDHSSE